MVNVADLAQLVEHLTCNEQVGSSILPIGNWYCLLGLVCLEYRQVGKATAFGAVIQGFKSLYSNG